LRWLFVWGALTMLAIIEIKFQPVGGLTLRSIAIGFIGVTLIPLLVFIVIGHLNMNDAERERSRGRTPQ
jgi:hypothetical protein